MAHDLHYGFHQMMKHRHYEQRRPSEWVPEVIRDSAADPVYLAKCHVCGWFVWTYDLTKVPA